MKRCPFIPVLFLLALPLEAQLVGTLRQATIQEFDQYQSEVDRELKDRGDGRRSFLWVDEHADLKQRAAAGQVVTFPITGNDGRSIEGGLIHDWVGCMYLKGRKAAAVEDLLRDTGRHPSVYPEVKAARILNRGDTGSVSMLRLVKKKYLTVVLDIEYVNQWRSLPDRRWTMTARSRKVSEVEDAGSPSEKQRPPDTGHGFLWRMNSQWSLREDDGGVWVELRSVSLSRDTPRGLGWMIRPLIRNFPAESIVSTMRATRTALE